MQTSRVLAITGGANGIGLATARRWVAAGGCVVLLDINRAALDAAVASLPAGAAHAIPCDVTERDATTAAIAGVESWAGRLDALVNAAGMILPAPSEKVEDAAFARVMEVNVAGTMRMCRAAHPLLKAAKGCIVNISSVAGIVGLPYRASYCASKSGVDGLTRILAVEWAPDAIRVNAVAPGYTRTEMTGHLLRDGRLNQDKIEARTPLRRFAEPDEIAAPIMFLMSPDASYVTGHTLVADGGMTVDGNWY